MPEPDDDFQTFLGPDRRKIPIPKGLGAVVAAIGLIVFVGLIALWPRDQPELDLSTFGFADDAVNATVVEAQTDPCSYGPEFTCNYFVFEITDETSVDDGLMVDFEFPDERGQAEFQVGDRVFVFAVGDETGTTTYQYSDRNRQPILLILTGVFALAVVLLGRLRGVAALAGLVISILILFWFVIPAIVSGTDAVLVALVGGGAIALVSLYLAHGYTPLTHVATLGAFGALAITTGLSWLVVSLAQFSGLVAEEAFYLLAIPQIDLNGLLLAGIVLGTIGVLDDVTVTQASAVWEVRKANPAMEASALYASGLRVGRDHIVSTVNTLLLAYAGASLPLLILFSLSNQGLGVVASSEIVALEIVRTLVGSIGLVAAVPITTWLGARAVSKIPVEDLPGAPELRRPGPDRI